jgi:hypothetical protein
MLKALFKKQPETPEEVEALQDANIALRVRMDKIVHFGLPAASIQRF